MSVVVPSFKTFLMVWLGQVVSVVGSGLTAFGLGVWVLMETGSTTSYAMVGLAVLLPMVVISPIAGVFVDRWDRRTTMVLADLVAGLSTLVVAILLYRGALELWHVIATSAVSSFARVFQTPAYTAAVTQLVPKEHLGRAGGMMQIAESLGTVLSPLIAAALIGTIGLAGIIAIDFATFLVAMATLAMVRFPQHERAQSNLAPSVLREAREGWQWVTARPGLLHFMFFFLVVNFVFGFVGVLYAPLVLAFSSPTGLGTVMAMAGIGGIVGGIAMGAWGGPKHGRAMWTILLVALVGLTVALTGVAPSLVVVSAAAFLTMVVLAVVYAVSQAFWQLKTDPAYQGRVFALRNMFAMLAMPIAYLLAGPLADQVFEPAMMGSSGLANVFGPVVGTGEGRGLGLMCVFGGLLATIVSLVAAMVPSLRNLDSTVPDHEPDTGVNAA